MWKSKQYLVSLERLKPYDLTPLDSHLPDPSSLQRTPFPAFQTRDRRVKLRTLSGPSQFTDPKQMSIRMTRCVIRRSVRRLDIIPRVFKLLKIGSLKFPLTPCQNCVQMPNPSVGFDGRFFLSKAKSAILTFYSLSSK